MHSGSTAESVSNMGWLEALLEASGFSAYRQLQAMTALIGAVCPNALLLRKGLEICGKDWGRFQG